MHKNTTCFVFCFLVIAGMFSAQIFPDGRFDGVSAVMKETYLACEGVYTIGRITDLKEKNATFAEFVSDDFVKKIIIDIRYSGNDHFKVVTDSGRMSDEEDASLHDLLFEKKVIYGVYNGAGGVTIELQAAEQGSPDGSFVILYDKTFGTWYDQLSEEEIEEFNKDERNITSVSFTGILKRNVRAYLDECDDICGRTVTAVDNLRLRSDGTLTGRTMTTMQKGCRVTIIAVGERSVIDGVASNWIQVSLPDNARDKDGSVITPGTTGWCFGGYVR